MIGFTEILLILIIILIIFGAGKFPKIMENFAEGIKIFKKTMNEKDSKNSSNEKKKKSQRKK